MIKLTKTLYCDECESDIGTNEDEQPVEYIELNVTLTEDSKPLIYHFCDLDCCTKFINNKNNSRPPSLITIKPEQVNLTIPLPPNTQ